MTIAADTPLSDALEMLSSKKPDAIIIVGPSFEFVGYFSAQDYREATRKLDTHQVMSARLNRSRKAISKKAVQVEEETDDDLLDLLLGDFEEEADEKDLPSINL